MSKFNATKTMEPTSPEVLEQLVSIHNEIRSLENQIAELKHKADSLVVKHSFEECREFGCVHTKHCRMYWVNNKSCVHSPTAHGAYRDEYKKKAPVFKPNVNYPTLGWRYATSRGSHYNGKWNWTVKVVKETEKTLVLDNGEQLLKNSLRYIEDCTYISSRGGVTYFCANSKDIMDAHLMMLDIERSEFTCYLKTTRCQFFLSADTQPLKLEKYHE